MPTVMCKDCGLLAVRDEYDDSVCEAIERTRENGTHQSSTGKLTDANIFCCAKSPAFPKLEKALSRTRTQHSPKGPPHPIVQAIGTEVECNLFRRWIPGKSPKEYEEMTILEKINSDTQAARQEYLLLQKEHRDQDIEWRQQVEASIEQRHIQAKNSDDRRHRQNRVLMIIAVSAAVVSALAAVLSITFE